MVRLERLAPWLFVLIWSSGFVVAKYAFLNSDVIFFLSLRLLMAGALLGVFTLAFGQSLILNRRQILLSISIGVALHALYLGGVWQSIAEGSTPAIASVVTSLQPVLVSVIAVKVLNESLKKSQGIGLFVGLAGVLLVLQPALSDSGGLTIEALALLVLALVGSTSATLMQKKSGDQTPLLAGTTYQFFAAGTLLFLFSLISGERSVDWNLESIMAMSWAVLVTSIIAILLLLWMLQKGSAAKVSSLLYLVPPMTAIQALMLFDEKLNPQSIIGIVMTALGVALVQKR